jgi:hypothetical protein
MFLWLLAQTNALADAQNLKGSFATCMRSFLAVRLQIEEFKIGLLKMRIVANQDKGRKQAPVTNRRTEDSRNDRDGPGGRGGGGGGGGGQGLWGGQLSPVPVPVPVQQRKPGEWFF